MKTKRLTFFTILERTTETPAALKLNMFRQDKNTTKNPKAILTHTLMICIDFEQTLNTATCSNTTNTICTVYYTVNVRTHAAVWPEEKGLDLDGE